MRADEQSIVIVDSSITLDKEIRLHGFMNIGYCRCRPTLRKYSVVADKRFVAYVRLNRLMSLQMIIGRMRAVE